MRWLIHVQGVATLSFDYNFSVLILSLTKVSPRLQKNLVGIDVDIDQNLQIYCAWAIQGDSLVIFSLELPTHLNINWNLPKKLQRIKKEKCSTV